jgi:hypothetical protein
MTGGLVPDLVWNRIRSIAEARHCFGESQSCPFSLREIGRLAPSRYSEETSSVSPALLALRAPPSTQELQPLIWLARK